jgi:hypothetical protein
MKKRRPLKTSVLFLCGVISLLASLLSIASNLGYLKPLKHALHLP